MNIDGHTPGFVLESLLRACATNLSIYMRVVRQFPSDASAPRTPRQTFLFLKLETISRSLKDRLSVYSRAVAAMKFGEVRRNSAKFDDHRNEPASMLLNTGKIGSSGGTRTPVSADVAA